MSSERWQRVAQLFGTASTLPPDQRSAYLEDSCGSDPDLRREVEALLAAEGDAASDYLRQAVVAAARDATAGARPSLAGRRIGPYEVTRELGHGGMGTVYVAVRADDAFRKTVAIKLVRPSVDDAEMRRRFFAERQILADLDHPHIARLLDGGTTEDGLPYVVMEHVEGEPLDVYCNRRALADPARLGLFLKVCAAVQDAHGHQIVHRDLKPGNILVTAVGEPKLLDFGIAKLLDPPTGTPVTRPADRLMTREYASPEQIRGESITTATDVYSLGVVLYELLAGQRPFAATTADALERAICEMEPARPSTLRNELPADVDAIVLMALRKESARRYASVQQLADDIRRHLAGEPVWARRGAWGYRAARFGRRHRARLAAAALVTLTAGFWALNAFAPAAGSGAPSPTPSPRRLAVLPFADLSERRDQQFLSEGISEEVLQALARIPSLEVIARTSSFRFRDASVDVREIAKRLGVDAVVEGSVRREGGRIRVTARLIDASSAGPLWNDVYARRIDDLFTLQEEMALAIAGALRLELTATTRHVLRPRPTDRGGAYELYLRGRHELNRRTEGGLWSAIEAFKAAVAADPDFAGAYAGLADAYGLMPAYANVSGPELLSLSKAAALRAVDLDSTLAEAHAALAASVLEYDHDRVVAERESRRALRLDPRSVLALRRYGLQLAGNGAFDSALVYVEHARRLDPVSPVAIGSVGTVYYFARRGADARQAFRDALALQPDWATGHAVLGRVYLMDGRVSEAVAELERAVVLSRGEANDRALLATAYAAAGRTPEARRIARDLASGSRDFIPAAGLAGLYVALGEDEAALHWLDRAVELRDTDVKYLKVDPRFDGLRGRPAFQAILERVGLSHPS